MNASTTNYGRPVVLFVLLLLLLLLLSVSLRLLRPCSQGHEANDADVWFGAQRMEELCCWLVDLFTLSGGQAQSLAVTLAYG